jgi:hypothetical protein
MTYSVALSTIILILALVLNTRYFKSITKPEYQVVLGTIVIAIILFDNAFSGLLIGLSIIILYARVIAHKNGINLDIMSLFNKSGSNLQNGNPMRQLVKDTPYITPKNLLNAQNNIVNAKNYNNTYIGIPKMNGYPVYSAEGTDVEGHNGTTGTSGVIGYEGKDIGSAVK